jgi:hypothetical protein
MQIQRVTGSNLRDALERAAKLHGKNALVLNRESGPNGEVVVAVAPQTESTIERLARFGFAGDDERERGAQREERERDPALFDIRQRLRRAGCSKEFVEGIAVRAGKARAKGMHPIDAAAAIASRIVPIADGPRMKELAAVIAHVGPEASAQRAATTALALRLASAGRHVTVASLEPHPSPEGDALEDGLAESRVEVLRSDDGTRIGVRLAEARALEVVIVNTGGRASFDGRQLTRLGTALQGADRLGSLSNHLVVAATRTRAALEQAFGTFARFRPKGIFATACDRTREFGPLFELAANKRCGLVFLAGRSGDAAQLVRPTPKLVADLLLTGSGPWK